MITAKALYASARLRSLPLSVSGVLLGSGAAYGAGAFRADIFALALLTTLLFQVLSDYANDYGDDGRLGPRRAIQTGQMSAAEMKRVIVATTQADADPPGGTSIYAAIAGLAPAKYRLFHLLLAIF